MKANSRTFVEDYRRKKEVRQRDKTSSGAAVEPPVRAPVTPLLPSRQPVRSGSLGGIQPAHGWAACKNLLLALQKNDCNARIIVLICTNSMSIETRQTAYQ